MKSLTRSSLITVMLLIILLGNILISAVVSADSTVGFLAEWAKTGKADDAIIDGILLNISIKEAKDIEKLKLFNLS